MNNGIVKRRVCELEMMRVQPQLAAIWYVNIFAVYFVDFRLQTNQNFCTNKQNASPANEWK